MRSRMRGFQGIFAASGRRGLGFELIDALFPGERLRHDPIEIVVLGLPAELAADLGRRRRRSRPGRRARGGDSTTLKSTPETRFTASITSSTE